MFEDVAETTKVHWALAGVRQAMQKIGNHDTGETRDARTMALRGEISIMSPNFQRRGQIACLQLLPVSVLS